MKSIFLLLLSSIFSRPLRAEDAPRPDFPSGPSGLTIEYGYELLAHTEKYLGPQGTVLHNNKNLMSCRNCHIDVGIREHGNSWLDTHGLYPQYRSREGVVQTLAERINTCLVHNNLGRELPTNGNEMKSMLSYFRWIARGRPILDKDPDQRLISLDFLARAANPSDGKTIYMNRCASCHGGDGQGRLTADKASYIYPPLWGEKSFMNGASLSRLSLLARFVKANMPYTSKAQKPTLTDDEAWDVAAFVASHERPKWKGKPAFPDLSEKPYDFPFGPYADSFSAEQHKYGPFKPILDYWVKRKGTQASDPTTGI